MDQKLKDRWERAINYAREILKIYQGIPTGMFGALIISEDIAMFEAGDRSQALLERLEGIK